MIPQIDEINFGPGTQNAYATLSNATATFAEMGDRYISTQVKIDGDEVPNFDNWELRFRGERFVLDIKDPQAVKDNTTRNSIIDLTFYSWAILQLKRYFIFETTTTAAGTVMADKYNASVSLNVNNFCALLNRVLDYYFHGKIYVDLNPGETYNPEPATLEMNYTYIWDVMQQFYKAFGLRWRIERDEETDSYAIKIGYPAPKIDDHLFEYGYNGGLLRFERQVQDPNIKNILLGRGGTNNVPYRYFKAIDPQNPGWAADPDNVPELANVYFDRIYDSNFRNYIQGWRTNRNGILGAIDAYDPGRGATDWAYEKGHNDTSFDPVEYVKDDASIAKYGEKWGHLEDNDEIYPTIQGIERGGGRVDTVLAVSEILTDDILRSAQTNAEIIDINGVISQVDDIPYGNGNIRTIQGTEFTVPEGYVVDVMNNGWFVSCEASPAQQNLLSIDTSRSSVIIRDVSRDRPIIPQGLTAGTYTYSLRVAVDNQNRDGSTNVTYGLNGLYLMRTNGGSGEEWQPTFDIWVRNIFESEQAPGETDEDYSLRVWQEILGDHLGQEATVVFSDGFMSISEDYEFKIAAYPAVDRSRSLNGFTSEWRITLYKSDAEFDATGLYIPNAKTGGKPMAGDHFFFTGIDMPHMYVTEAEKRVNEYKQKALDSTSDISPTWVISLDKVRMDEPYNQSRERLFDKIEAGAELQIRDERFTLGRTLDLFVETATFTWSESTVVLPDVEVVLSDEVYVVDSPVQLIQNDLNVLKASMSSISNFEQVTKDAMRPLYLAKTGEEQTSLSPTRFAGLLSSDDFRQGGMGGQGWGFYRDNSYEYQNDYIEAAQTRSAAQGDQPRMLRARGASQSGGPLRAEGDSTSTTESDAPTAVRSGGLAVMEVDKLIVRKEMQVNNLVINQIAYVGGKQIISAAAMECVQVVENDDSYDCYFDQKQGSVKNLFQVNDIAMGQIFSPENIQLRFYKRIVTKVGLDYIRLAKDGAYGSGVPEKGDVIVQFGNTVNEDRRYAIVRDVIGGGYEQMLSNLDTVYASGEEYYFAGISAVAGDNRLDLMTNEGEQLATSQGEGLTVLGGSKPRFYIGDPDSKIEYTATDATIRLKGNIVQSPAGVEFPVPCFRSDGPYSAEKWYYYGDMVVHNGASWIHIGKNPTKGTVPQDGDIWRLYADKGAPVVVADLDNEMDAIGVGPDGVLDVAIPKANALTTTYTLYYGTQAQPLTGLTVSDVPTGISYERVQSEGAYTGLIKFWAPAPPVDLTAGRYPITITGSATINGQSVSYTCVYTLIGSKQGADGTTFILVPNINAVKKTATGQLSDAYIVCTATDSTGTELNTYYIYYSRDGGAKALYKQRVNGGSATYGAGLSNGIPTDNITTNVKLYLYLTTEDISNDRYVDTETVPLIIDGASGDSGVAIFRWTQNAATAPTLPSSLEYPPIAATHWSSSAPDRPTGSGSWYLWMSTGNLNKTSGTVDAWTTAVRISGDDGLPGEDADDREWIYGYSSSGYNGNTGQVNPSGTASGSDTNKNQDDWVPNGWRDNPAGVDFANKTEYASYRDITVNGTTKTYGAFQTPIVWSHYGERGIDGDGVEYVFARTKENVAPVVPSSGTYSEASQGYDSDNHLPYVRVAKAKDISGSTDPVTSGNYKYVKCTDDPVGVDTTWPYEWVLKRSKSAPGASGTAQEGVRQWEPYSGSMAVWARVGEKGSTGRIMRGVTEWASGTAYQGYNDDYDAATENIFYDVVYIPDPSDTTQKLYFYCKTGHTAASTNKPSAGGNTWWGAANQFDFVATKVFLADNAQIDFLTGNDILVKDGSTVVAGVLGGTGVNFFAGATKDNATEAPFRVNNNGRVDASNLNITGGSVRVSGDAGSDPSGTSYSIMTDGGISGKRAFIYDYSNNQYRRYLAVNDASLQNDAVEIFDATGNGALAVSGATSLNGRTSVQGDFSLSAAHENTIGNEYIVSSPTIRHIVICEHGQVPAVGSRDANTLYLEKKA